MGAQGSWGLQRRGVRIPVRGMPGSGSLLQRGRWERLCWVGGLPGETVSAPRLGAPSWTVPALLPTSPEKRDF